MVMPLFKKLLRLAHGPMPTLNQPKKIDVEDKATPGNDAALVEVDDLVADLLQEAVNAAEVAEVATILEGTMENAEGRTVDRVIRKTGIRVLRARALQRVRLKRKRILSQPDRNLRSQSHLQVATLSSRKHAEKRKPE